MRRAVMAAAAVASLLMAASSAFAYPERAIEVWRSRYGFMGRGATNPVDGSLWQVEGATVTHTAVDGTLLGRSPGLAMPAGPYEPRGWSGMLAINPADGTCWVTQYGSDAVVHLALDGHILSSTPGLWCAVSLLVNPQDGSVWVNAYDGRWEGYEGYFARLSATGEVLLREVGNARILAVDPSDGTAWRAEYDGTSHTTEVARLQPDGRELWSVVLPFAAAVGGEDARDQSLWVAGSKAARLARDGTVLWQGGGYWGSATSVWVSPRDGSAWISCFVSGDEPPVVLHLASSGAELLRREARIVGQNDADGSVWLWNVGASALEYEQIGADGNTLNGFDHPSLIGLPVYSPSDNSFWAVAGLTAGTADQLLYLLRLGPDGSVLNRSERPWSSCALLGPTLNPRDGSIWVEESGRYGHWGTSEATVLLSAEGVELERRTPGVGAWVRPTWAAISPFDGSWWASYSEATPNLHHLAPDGTELSVIPDFTYGPVINPADGSVWGQWTRRRGDGTLRNQATLGRATADGEVLWTRAYGTSLSDPVLEPDGSAWVIVAPYEGASAREHIAADGTYLGDLPLTSQMVTDLTADPPASVHGLTQGPDGTIYALVDFYGPGGQGSPTGSAVRCFTHDGELLWEREVAGPICLLVNPADHSVWVTSYGVEIASGPRGSCLSHLAADGTLLWQGDGFDYPQGLRLDPRDGSVWVDDRGNAQIVHLRATRSPFNDVLEDFWAYDEITACYDAHIVTGYPDGTFRPKQIITRDLMAAYIARARFGGDELVPTGPATASFSDVPPSYGFYRHIEYCHGQGMVTGYKDGTYHPEWGVNRGQMAAFLARSQCGGDAFVPTGPATASFTDVPLDFGFYRYIEYLHTAGITTGYSDGTYHPEWVCNRDQMAVFVARAFRLLP